MGVPPGVHKTSVEKGGHAVDFLLRVARRFVVVRLRPGKVNGGVGHVEISTTDHGLVCVQFAQVIAKGLVPLSTEWQALEA